MLFVCIELTMDPCSDISLPTGVDGLAWLEHPGLSDFVLPIVAVNQCLTHPQDSTCLRHGNGTKAYL